MSQIIHADKQTDHLRNVLQRVVDGERINSNEILAVALSALADKISGEKVFTRDQLVDAINKKFKFGARKSNSEADAKSFDVQKAMHRWYAKKLGVKLAELLPVQLISVQLSDANRLELIWVEKSAMTVLKQYSRQMRRFLR